MAGRLSYIGAARFQGFWDAVNNGGTGSIDDTVYGTLFVDGGYAGGTGLTASNGDYWQVKSVDRVTPTNNTTIDSIFNWFQNDWVIYSGSQWIRLPFEDTMASIVMGDVSAVTAFHMSASSDKHVLFTTLSGTTGVHSGSDDFVFDHTSSRVGLGTKSPAYTLDLLSTGSAFRVKNTTNGADLNCVIINEGTTSTDDALLSITTEPAAGDPSLRFAIDGNETWSMGIDNSDSDKFKISNSSTVHTDTRLTIHGNKIGIGTTTPAHTVQIDANSGSHGLQVNGYQNKYTVSLRSDTTTGQAYGPYIRGGTNSTDSALVVTDASGATTYLRVRGDGNVGIKTDAPAHTLDVAGDINLTGDFSFDASSTVVNSIKDEDDLSSDSATALATQQSIKAYVDAQVTAQDLDFQGDSGGALSIDLDSETLDIAGGTGIDTSGSGNTLTVAIDSTVATKTYVDTLVTAQDLDLTTDSGTIDVDLDSETLTIAGTSNEISTSATGSTVTISLPDDVTIGSDLSVTDSLVVDTNTLVVNASGYTDKVGVNSATPSYTLDVVPSSASAFRVRGASDGVDVNCAIENAGTDSGDDALLSITTQGGAGDASLRLAIAGNETYSVGVDNSDGDKFKISQASTLHTDTRLTIHGPKVGIGTTTPDNSAILDLSSTTRGFLPPRLTTTQRDAVGSPAEGLLVYNDTTNALNFYNGSSWAAVGTGGGSVSAINNAAANRLVTIGSTTTELDGEAGLTYDGTTMTVSGSILPNDDVTKDLGSATKRWANIYTGDLHLKNDRGDWTIVEEEDYLTIINNKKGKRYKFVLEEID